VSKPIDQEMLFLKLRKFVVRPETREDSATGSGPEGGVAGSLSDMSFADLIQMVTASGKTMSIALTTKEGRGEVVVLNGDVVHATAGDKEGEAAFYQMMRWQEGTFVTSRAANNACRTINAPVMSLLMEGARLADESDAAKH